MDIAPGRAKILIVDDEPAIREIENSILSELGHQVIEAGSGAEALRLAREEEPDLILLDVMMREPSGIEVCRQLRADKTTRDIRIIVVSGVDAKQALEESIVAGADDFLAKPIDTLELLVRVRSMLRVRHVQDHEKRLADYIRNLQTMRGARRP